MKSKFLKWEFKQIELPHNTAANNEILEEKDHHYIYIGKKLPEADEESNKYFNECLAELEEE